MRWERSTDAVPATVRRLGIEEADPPLPYNVSRLDTLLQGKTPLRGAIECGVTMAILLLLLIALTIVRVCWGLAGLTGTPA